MKRVLLAVLAFVGLVPLSSLAVLVIFSRGIIGTVADAPVRNVALVLGTGRMASKSLVSPVFQARMDAAAALYKAGKAQKLLISGYREGKGRATGNYDEPADMLAALTALGVPKANILVDDQAWRTYDSVRNVACVSHLKRLLIVSQRLHLARALFLAWSFGLQGIGVAAHDPPPSYEHQEWLLEGAARLKALMDLVRGGLWPCHVVKAPIWSGRNEPQRSIFR